MMGAAEQAASLVELSVERRVAVLALTNPERRNVLDAVTAAALRAVAERLADMDEVRCAVITGSGNTFAAGADLREIEAASAAENLAYNRLLRAAVDAVAALPMPSVAAVNGHAIGGGLELALACTLRVAAAEAKLGMPEARLGILPATGGLARLPRLIAPSTAARLLLTGDLVDAAEAERIGLVDSVVPAAEVWTAAHELADRIAAAAPLSTRAILDALRHDAQLPVDEANARTEERLAGLLDSADRREGARAFLDRRDPEFEGR